MAVDALEELAAAQRAMVAADRRRKRAARRHREASADTKVKQRARMTALRRATADGTPEVMKAAAAAMGISVSRVYQLLREYDKEGRRT